MSKKINITETHKYTDVLPSSVIISGGGGVAYNDSSISTALSTEISTRNSADYYVSTNLSSAISTSNSNITSIGATVANMTTVSEELLPNISSGQLLYYNGSVISGTTNLFSSLSTAINNVNPTGITSLSTAISGEIYTRGSQVSSLSTAISSGGGGFTGTTEEIGVELSSGQILTYNGTHITGITNSFSSLSTAISTEGSSRTSGDNSLSSAIANMGTTSADTSLSTAVSTETSTRGSQATSLSTAVSTANSTRASADSSLSTAVSGKLDYRTFGSAANNNTGDFVSTQYNSSLNSDSRNSRGVTRLYREDNDSDYSVQTYWTGSKWYLAGYNGDTLHADCQVGYANNAGSLGGTAAASYALLSSPSFTTGVNNNGYFSSTLDVNKATFVGNWPATGYWGIGGIYSTNNIKIEGCSDTTGTWSGANVALNLTGTLSISSTATATNFILSSDKRIKENIKSIPDKPINVEYKQFNLIGDTQIRYGVIAQDLEKEHPELVITNDKGIKSVAYFDLLIKEIHDLKKRVSELEKMIK